MGGGKLLHCEIYQQDIILSEKISWFINEVGRPLYPHGHYLSNDIKESCISNSAEIGGKIWCCVYP